MLDLSIYIFISHYAVSLNNVREFVFGLASWTDAIVSQSEKSRVHVLLNDVCTEFIVAYNYTNNIITERNPDDSASCDPSSHPSVLPHELVKITPVEFLRKN